jgi:hypothetical protein
MTDTATHLSEQQLARVEALKAARTVLSSQALLSSGAVNPSPVIEVACYIIDGQTPWTRPEAEAAS